MSNEEREAARAELRELCSPGTTVYTVLRHVSRSGMVRVIDPMVLVDGRPRRIGYLMQKLGGWKLDNKFDGLRVGGAGMDMGFHVVYGLGFSLYRDGWQCIGERCPANDHSNGDRDYTPHLHSDGGYALQHEWL